jgi:phage tail-like protein
MPNGREDPLVGFHFALDLGGTIAGYFTECSGIGSEHEVIEHKVINESGLEVVMKIPGRLKWENIVLKRGITSAMDIWDWRKTVEDGKVQDARRNGSIIMYDQSLKPVAQWDFERAWPLKVSGPQPKADSNEIGIEELTITHEYIHRVK